MIKNVTFDLNLTLKLFKCFFIALMMFSSRYNMEILLFRKNFLTKIFNISMLMLNFH